MATKALRSQGDSLLPFFILTFAFTWGIAALLMLFPTTVEALFGEVSTSHPIFILAVAGPTVVATLLTVVREGWPGLRRLYARLMRWHFGIRWYALLLIGIPLLGYLVAQIAGPEVGYDLSTPALLFAALFNLLISGPLGEELGWRGFALPRLLKRFTPLVASLILGAIWGVWHLPAFFLSSLPQSSLAIPVFMFASICLAVLVTWIFNYTEGSVLSIVLFHYMVNFSMNILGAPFLAFTLVVAVATVLVVVFDRRLGWFRQATALETREVYAVA